MNSRVDKTDFEPRAGNRLFPRAGIFVSREEDYFFTVKSGFSSTIHKHCDDNSIILWHKGHYLLCDTGSYNYDYANPVRQFVAGTRGHSSIFPMGFYEDAPSGSEYAKHVKPKQMRLISESDSGDFHVRCGIVIDEGATDITREIRRSGSVLSVMDAFVNREPRAMRQRFIFHPDAACDMSITQGVCKVAVDNGGAGCIIRTEERPDNNYLLPDGYYSEDYGKYRECKVFDVVTRELSSGVIATTVELC